MSSTDSSSSKSADSLPDLPAGFVPGDHDVVIGKGKKFYFHTGNQWLRTLVASMLDEYSQAQTKSDKSNIISDVVEYVRQNGRFVKRDIKSGKWVYAEPLLCREKCSQTFRDNLAETYRSSNVAKRNKRRAEQQEKKRMPDAKRMRVAAPAAPAMATRAPAPIPSTLFDLEMPLWSPKQPTMALFPNSLDFSALGRPSITGTAGGDSLNLNGSFQLSGLSSMNLMQNLPDILSNLSAGVGLTAAVSTGENPFEPTPMPGYLPGSLPVTLPPLAGTVTPSATENATPDSILFEPRPMAEKRHSLATISDVDWFKINNEEAQPDLGPKISAAFAA